MTNEVTTLGELSLGDRFELLDGRYKIRIWTVTERLSAYKLCACVADNGKTTKLSFRQRVSRISPMTDRSLRNALTLAMSGCSCPDSRASAALAVFRELLDRAAKNVEPPDGAENVTPPSPAYTTGFRIGVSVLRAELCEELKS